MSSPPHADGPLAENGSWRPNGTFGTPAGRRNQPHASQTPVAGSCTKQVAQTWAGFSARRRRRSTEHDRALLVCGDSAAVVLAQVTALAALVEKETGLTAYDPRTGCPLTKAPPEEPAGLMARVTEELRGRYGG